MTRRRASMPPRLMKLSAALAVVLAASSVALSARADEVNWATTRATELTNDGAAREKSGLVEAAVDLYREAISIDPTYGPAYLALAELRTRMGDPDEAELTYAAGIDHVLGFVEAYVARAELLRGEGRVDAAIGDLLLASALAPEDIPVAQKLSDAAIAAGRLPLALAASRRLSELARRSGDSATQKSAQITAVALSRILGSLDPVTASDGRCAVRRALAKSSSAWK